MHANALIVVLSHAADPLKPYVLFILDTSGSMDGATGSGPPSCGGADTRINHAKCAINNIANSYTPAMTSDSQLQMLTGLVEGNNFRSAIYTDNVCTVCSTDYSLGAEVLGSSVGEPYCCKKITLAAKTVTTWRNLLGSVSDGC